jgi:P pilus assembly chaperone PapD
MAARLPALAAALAFAAVLAMPTATQAGTRPAVVLAVSPTRAEIPPTRHTAMIDVYSNSAQTIEIVSSVQALVQDTGGALTLGSQPPQYGQDWLTVTPSRFSLRPGQSQHVAVRIAIPPHQGGQRYLAVVFRALTAHKAAPGSDTAFVAASVASSLIIDTPGKVRHQTSLALSAPGFSSGGPLSLGLTIRNRGNVYALDNRLDVLRGGRVVARFDGALVLAGATRRETVTWTAAPAFCVCSLRLAGTAQTITVIRFPVLQVIGLLLVVLAMALLLRTYTRAVRRRAIAQAVRDGAGEQAVPRH